MILMNNMDRASVPDYTSFFTVNEPLITSFKKLAINFFRFHSIYIYCIYFIFKYIYLYILFNIIHFLPLLLVIYKNNCLKISINGYGYTVIGLPIGSETCI
jgi:hypothetical protein